MWQLPQATLQQAAKYKVVFVLGGPGSGKGTQCNMLLQEEAQEGDRSVVHLSAGELLRALVRGGSEEGEMVKAITSRGHIVPSYITVNLMVQAMCEQPAGTLFVIDGYPRNDDNRSSWHSLGLDCEAVVFLDCSEDVLVTRLLGRDEGRADDRDETVIRERIRVFNEETMPQVLHYEAQGKLRRVPANGTVEEVFAGFREALGL
ncbi:unnamed protein product [Pedinophyceae sp. YPF-701]|nr:unnamed protein product [Pedinophyceae sp. YPF-701]